MSRYCFGVYSARFIYFKINQKKKISILGTDLLGTNLLTLARVRALATHEVLWSIQTLLLKFIKSPVFAPCQRPLERRLRLHNNERLQHWLIKDRVIHGLLVFVVIPIVVAHVGWVALTSGPMPAFQFYDH